MESQNSICKSKSSLNESSEDVKVFVKLSSKYDHAQGMCLQKRVFFFEENRQVLLLQKGYQCLMKYKYDYIFSDYDNTLLIANSIKSTVTNLLRNEKNLSFITFGEEKLGKTNFLFGSNSKINKDSFFKKTVDSVIKFLLKELQFDNILIDIFKVSNEKYVLDYRNVAHDMKYDIVDVINQIIYDGARNSETNSINSDCSNEDEHFIIILKFFKFVTDKDINKEQREVEIIRTVSFVDIEGFTQTFTEDLLNKNEYLTNNSTNYTLLQFKNLIESIASQDFNKYSQVNSIISTLLTDIFKIQNTTYFFFGFINQNDGSIIESNVTLEIMNKFKNIYPDTFFDVVQDLNLDVINEENNLKEEYHVIENIFSELIFYIEKTLLLRCENKNNIFEHNFFTYIKDFSQVNKFMSLNEFLLCENLNWEYFNPIAKMVYDSVLSFFQNRSKWKILYKARDDIISLNMTYKESEKIDQIYTPNETDELRSVLRNLSKVVKNVEENENNSIFEKLSENNNAINNADVFKKIIELEEENVVDKIISERKLQSISKSKTINNLKTTVDTTNRPHFPETSFIQGIIKLFMKNMQKSCKNMLIKLTNEGKCMPCMNGTSSLESVDFSISIHHFQILKAAMQKQNKELKDNLSFNDLKKDSLIMDNGNLKTTNIRSNILLTKTDENMKNQEKETNFKPLGQTMNTNMDQPKNIINNNIVIDKNFISDIFSSNHVSVNIRNRYSRSNPSYSQSIQIFKLNLEDTLKKSDNFHQNKKEYISEKSFNKVVSFDKNIIVDNRSALYLQENLNIQHRNSDKNSYCINKYTNSANYQSSQTQLNLSERISKIEKKLHNLNDKFNNSNIFNFKNTLILDSKIKSFNEPSYEEIGNK